MPDVTTLTAPLIAHATTDTLVPAKSAVTLTNVYLVQTTVAIMRSAPILMVILNAIVNRVIPVTGLPALTMMNALLESILVIAMPHVPILMVVIHVNVILVIKVTVSCVMISTNVLLESITVIPMLNVPTMMAASLVAVTTATLVME